MIRKVRIALTIAVLIAIVGTAFCYTPVSSLASDTSKIGPHIIHPSQARPLIALKGQDIDIYLFDGDKTLKGNQLGNWEAELSREIGPATVSVPLKIKSVNYEPSFKIPESLGELSYIPKSSNIWHVIATIPSEAPNEIYDINISYNKTIVMKKPTSVKVIDQFKDKYRFMVVADPHMGGFRLGPGTPGDIVGSDEYKLMQRWDLLYWMSPNYKVAQKILSEIELLNPEFVLFCGDITYGAAYDTEYKYALNDLISVSFPTFLVPGNHDGYATISPNTGSILRDGFKWWEDFFGPLYHSFSYGNFYFIGLNSYDKPISMRSSIKYAVSGMDWGGGIQKDQLDWLKNEINKAKAEGKTVIPYLHNDPTIAMETNFGDYPSFRMFTGPGREELLSLLQEANPPITFAAHTHYDLYYEREDLRVVHTTSMGDTASYEAASKGNKPPRYWGYREVSVKDGNIENFTYDDQPYDYNFTISSSHSIPYGNLNLTFKPENNGLNKELTAKIDNKLAKDMTDLMVKFIVPYDSKGYAIENGQVVQIVHSNDNKYSIYYVTVDVNASSTKEIRIKQL